MYERESLEKNRDLAQNGIKHTKKSAHPNPNLPSYKDGRESLLIHTFISRDAEEILEIFKEQLNIIDKVLNV